MPASNDMLYDATLTPAAPTANNLGPHDLSRVDRQTGQITRVPCRDLCLFPRVANPRNVDVRIEPQA